MVNEIFLKLAYSNTLNKSCIIAAMPIKYCSVWIYRENWFFSFIWNTYVTKLRYYEYQYYHQKTSSHCHWSIEWYGLGHHPSIAAARLSCGRQLAENYIRSTYDKSLYEQYSDCGIRMLTFVLYEKT
jgi:hypothetical protein